MEKQNNNNTDKYEPQATKISPEMAVVWNAICNTLGTDTYHMLQWFIYAMIRAASEAHELSPDIKKLMAILDSDFGWQKAFNMCAPNGKLSISQMILIVEQEGHRGFGAVMIDKPYFDQCKQTECVDDIFERVTEVCLKGIYKKLRRMAVDMDCKSMADLLLTMIDNQTAMNQAESERHEMQGQADFNDRGKQIAYGKRSRGYKHRTPDSLDPNRNRILFTDDENPLGDIKPFTEEP